MQEYMDHLGYFADYVHRHRSALPFIIWRDASVQHFNTPTGKLCLHTHSFTRCST